MFQEAAPAMALYSVGIRSNLPATAFYIRLQHRCLEYKSLAMYQLQLALRTILALLVAGATATPNDLVRLGVGSHEKRLVCNQDNVLRALQANSAAAAPFCVTFGHIPIPTITVPVKGVTPTV